MHDPNRQVVLLGLGHTNAHLLGKWRRRPLRQVELTCVSDFPTVTYSGMLPGVLAGQYSPSAMQIDLKRLCAAAGARLIVGRVSGLDAQGRKLFLENQPLLPFDVLSIGVGSVPRLDVQADDTVQLIKPMQTFLARLEAWLRALQPSFSARPLRIAVVGAGAGGVEITFCLPHRVGALLGDVPLELTLVDSGRDVAGGLLPKTQQLVRRELMSRSVQLRLGRSVTSATGGKLTLADGEQLDADLVLWTTGAMAPSILSQLQLPTDQRGFLITRPTLQTIADAPIFIVGDAGTIDESAVPKAGVYAVRQGPILWENIWRLLAGRPLKTFRPQEKFLKLLNTGDGRAVAEFRGFTFFGRWCWRWKDLIDRQFIKQFRV